MCCYCKYITSSHASEIFTDSEAEALCILTSTKLNRQLVSFIHAQDSALPPYVSATGVAPWLPPMSTALRALLADAVTSLGSPSRPLRSQRIPMASAGAGTPASPTYPELCFTPLHCAVLKPSSPIYARPPVLPSRLTSKILVREGASTASNLARSQRIQKAARSLSPSLPRPRLSLIIEHQKTKL